MPEEDEKLTNFEKLVLVLEDRRFFSHSGFDVWASAREVAKLLTFQRHGGASTIDMQFVRTATGYKEKTFRRKLYEMALAFLIQYRYSKIQILRSYLRCAFFGSGIFGAGSACQKVFDKELYEVTDEEASQLAAMLVYPRPRKPTSEWENRIKRRASYGLLNLRRFEERFNKLPSGS